MGDACEKGIHSDGLLACAQKGSRRMFKLLISIFIKTVRCISRLGSICRRGQIIYVKWWASLDSTEPKCGTQEEKPAAERKKLISRADEFAYFSMETSWVNSLIFPSSCVLYFLLRSSAEYLASARCLSNVCHYAPSSSWKSLRKYAKMQLKNFSCLFSLSTPLLSLCSAANKPPTRKCNKCFNFSKKSNCFDRGGLSSASWRGSRKNMLVSGRNVFFSSSVCCLYALSLLRSSFRPRTKEFSKLLLFFFLLACCCCLMPNDDETKQENENQQLNWVEKLHTHDKLKTQRRANNFSKDFSGLFPCFFLSLHCACAGSISSNDPNGMFGSSFVNLSTSRAWNSQFIRIPTTKYNTSGFVMSRVVGDLVKKILDPQIQWLIVSGQTATNSLHLRDFSRGRAATWRSELRE